MARPVRLAVRAVILHDDRLLLVNAYKGRTDLWCAPGGGVEPHQSLPANLQREVTEECGLRITVGPVCLINEFHDLTHDFHQVDIYFRAALVSGSEALRDDWRDPEDIVSHRRWVSRGEMAQMRIKPDSLAAVAWSDPDAPDYDPLEPILR